MLFAPAGPLAGRTPLESRLRCMFGTRRRVLLQACIYKVIRGDDGIRPKQGIEKLIVVILVIVRNRTRSVSIISVIIIIIIISFVCVFVFGTHVGILEVGLGFSV